jgi:uncharacterized membrane protein
LKLRKERKNMVTTAARDYKRAIGVFKTRRETEQALYQVRDRGIDLKQVSVIASDSDPQTKHPEVYTHSQGNHADTGAVSGAIAGGTLGIITGLLVGLGALAIPGIGPILLAGAEATALATTLAGTAIGATSGGIIGALIGLGIPEDQAKIYNDRLSEGQYIVLVTGTPGTVEQARDILRDQGIEELNVYDALQVEVTPRMDDVVSPTTLERNERLISPDREVVHPQRREIIEGKERTIVTPRVETKHPVEYDRQPEVIEHKEKVVISHSQADIKDDDLKTIDYKKVSDHPEVIVIDRRDEEYKNP